MEINAVSLFENYGSKMKRLKKKSYSKYMDEFRTENADSLKSLIQAFSESQTENSETGSVTDEFASQIFEAHQKKGKVKSAQKMDLNLFLICYVFPAILLTEDQNATALCDSLRDSWNKKFEVSIDYTDFNTLLGGFNDKLFGIF